MIPCLIFSIFGPFQKVDPQIAGAIDEFILKLRACATGNSSFTFILDDPAGNSFIENPYVLFPLYQLYNLIFLRLTLAPHANHDA